MRFTVFGADGFIGSRLVGYLSRNKHDVVGYVRGRLPHKNEHLGHVIYAIGLTGDFRYKPFETIDANVSVLADMMRYALFDSWLYLSSVRVYGTESKTASELDKISVCPGADSIYDISKLLGESLCFALEHSTVRVVRLSNVYGGGQSCHSFLGSILSDLSAGRKVVIHESPESTKDYISILDVVALLERISLYGNESLYNVASGRLISHKELACCISKIAGVPVEFDVGASERKFPCVDIHKIVDEFAFTPRDLLADFSGLAKSSFVHH